jgi:hypothetical protein
VRHALIDWGDCLGQLWRGSGAHARWSGNVYFFDPSQILLDFVSLGARVHPWERARFGPAGARLGYFGGSHFEPEAWAPHYPNPAFSRRTERDLAWMARIIARFDDAMIRAIVERAKIMDPVMREELVRALLMRRDRILQRFLTRLSPLTDPRVTPEASGVRVCFEDLAVLRGLPAGRNWAMVTRAGTGSSVRVSATSAAGRVCLVLLELQAAPGQHVEIEIVKQTAAVELPARLLLYRDRTERYRVVALERLDAR